jgi:hypothetical protein
LVCRAPACSADPGRPVTVVLGSLLAIRVRVGGFVDVADVRVEPVVRIRIVGMGNISLV